LGRSNLYRSVFTDDALNDVKRLPKNVRNALKKEFEKKIHVDPFSCSEELAGILGHYRSFHYGNYRVVYRVFEGMKVVSVVGLGKKNKDHQTDLYKRLEDLANRGRLADAVLETYRTISLDKPK
jgi:mRNA-degrading endonuclease RelE of RelBE toxin-antitoxin system